jgi:hypothetical protein
MPAIKNKFVVPARIIMLASAVVGTIFLLKRNRNNIEAIAEQIDDEADETIEKLEAAIAASKSKKA